MAAKGIVFIVGCGPGLPGLLTVRGSELLARADAVVYGRKLQRKLIPVGASGGPERFYVGGRGATERATPEEIAQLLTTLARRDLRVVYLVHGDPLAFGRATDVATALHDASVEFEIVPGVPTLNAAATYGGIPLLSSTMSSATVFVDGRLRTDPAQRPNWKAIAETGATVVIRNGLTMMRDIAADFIAAGVSADIPAAVVSHPGRVSQRVIVATLGTLSDVVFEARLMTNPTVIIGWPVLLRDELNWYDARPLTGRRVVLARGRYGNTAVAGRLEDIGAFVVEVPQPGIARLDLAELRGAIEGIAGYEWIVFATPAAVDIFWAEMILSGRDTRALANARIACLDPATAAALLDRGITVDVTQDRFAATPLIDILSERSDIPGAALLYVAGDGVAASFARDLENAGASVTALSIYREVPLARPLTRFRRTLHARPIDLAVVMSPGAATDYVLASGEAGLDEIPAAAYDAATADVLRESGVDVAVVPDRPGLELFIEAIRSKVPAIFEK